MAISERQRQARDPIIVFPFLDWCQMRGISVATGRVKTTQLSERRIGIRSDHDQEFLDSCLRDSA